MERIDFDRVQSQQAGRKRQELDQVYGSFLTQYTEHIQTLEARQQQGGLWYRLTGKARQDRQALHGLHLTRASTQQRFDEAWGAFQKAQAQARTVVDQRQDRERQGDEQRITAQLQTGRTPAQERRERQRAQAALLKTRAQELARSHADATHGRDAPPPERARPRHRAPRRRRSSHRTVPWRGWQPGTLLEPDRDGSRSR
jgi:hypothetical protein